MCSLTSSGIIGEHFKKFLRFQKVLNKRVPLILANVYLRKNIYFNIINDISPHFKIVLSNERLNLCDYFK